MDKWLYISIADGPIWASPDDMHGCLFLGIGDGIDRCLYIGMDRCLYIRIADGMGRWLYIGIADGISIASAQIDRRRRECATSIPVSIPAFIPASIHMPIHMMPPSEGCRKHYLHDKPQLVQIRSKRV